jgi:hypothetical protein
MHYLFTWETGHPTLDVWLQQARQHWEELTLSNDPAANRELSRISQFSKPAHSDMSISSSWAATFYLLPYPEQIILAFVWLHWWHQSAEEEGGFGGWLIQGPGFVLNHVSLLKVLTEQQRGILGILNGFLEKIVEQAGDWNGDRESYPHIVQLLEKLNAEYRYNIHALELWPAVLQLIQD